MISSARTSRSGGLSNSSRLSSLSQKRWRLTLLRFDRSFTYSSRTPLRLFSSTLFSYRSRLASGFISGFIQQHPQLFGATHTRGFEASGECRIRANERRDVAFEKTQPVGSRFVNQVDARRPVDREDPGDFQRRTAHPLREAGVGERRVVRSQQILAEERVRRRLGQENA